jgi:hypothetical protein
MLVAFARYTRDDSFQALKTNKMFVLAMTTGSITGIMIGGAPPRRRPRNRADSPARRPPHRLMHQSLATPLNHRPEPALVTITSQRS